MMCLEKRKIIEEEEESETTQIGTNGIAENQTSSPHCTCKYGWQTDQKSFTARSPFQKVIPFWSAVVAPVPKMSEVSLVVVLSLFEKFDVDWRENLKVYWVIQTQSPSLCRIISACRAQLTIQPTGVAFELAFFTLRASDSHCRCKNVFF